MATHKTIRKTKKESRSPLHPLSRQEIIEEVNRRVNQIQKEFKEVFSFINHYPKSVTFFGSARFSENNEHCQRSRALAHRLSKLGYSILTGGGGGIMDAANHGAYDAGGPSLGINIKLPEEQMINRYLSAELECSYFFSRKTALSFAAEAYIFFPGGFGTLDEFFELATLIQTKKIPAVPLILIGKDYWEPLDQFIYEQMYVAHNAIKESDRNIYMITDDEDKIVRVIEASTATKDKTSNE